MALVVRWQKTTQYLVVSIDYALAPEHLYPSGLNDVYEVASWVYHHANDIKSGFRINFTMIGDSAGGKLYRVVCGSRQ